MKEQITAVIRRTRAQEPLLRPMRKSAWLSLRSGTQEALKLVNELAQELCPEDQYVCCTTDGQQQQQHDVAKGKNKRGFEECEFVPNKKMRARLTGDPFPYPLCESCAARFLTDNVESKSSLFFFDVDVKQSHRPEVSALCKLGWQLSHLLSSHVGSSDLESFWREEIFKAIEELGKWMRSRLVWDHDREALQMSTLPEETMMKENIWLLNPRYQFCVALDQCLQGIDFEAEFSTEPEATTEDMVTGSSSTALFWPFPKRIDRGPGIILPVPTVPVNLDDALLMSLLPMKPNYTPTKDERNRLRSMLDELKCSHIRILTSAVPIQLKTRLIAPRCYDPAWMGRNPLKTRLIACTEDCSTLVIMVGQPYPVYWTLCANPGSRDLYTLLHREDDVEFVGDEYKVAVERSCAHAQTGIWVSGAEHFVAQGLKVIRPFFVEDILSIILGYYMNGNKWYTFFSEMNKHYGSLVTCHLSSDSSK